MTDNDLVLGIIKSRHEHGPDRKPLHAQATPQAHEQWHDVATANGTSFSALMEVMAPQLADLLEANPKLVENARVLDGIRRRGRGAKAGSSA